jgi:hypothetical protein
VKRNMGNRELRVFVCAWVLYGCALGATSAPIEEGGNAAAVGDSPSRVQVVKTPDGGIQPQALVDRAGTIHLIYFKGDPAAGDLYYTTRAAAAADFAPAVRVNSQPGSAVAIGTIRGGQLALARNGFVHVAWNGSGKAAGAKKGMGSPMLYARSADAGKSFERERNLMTRTSMLDGGGTVAADGAGNVLVLWHGRAPGAADGEMGRSVWIARSTDDGATFAAEEPVITDPTGACGCCGTRSFADSKGSIYMLYRAATHGVDRDMTLLAADGGKPFHRAVLDPWRLNACPMSSEAITEGGRGVFAAWETNGQVFFTRVDLKMKGAPPKTSPPGGAGDRKHPALASNGQGETILVWTEGTGWQRGGALAWQVFDASGQPTSERGRVAGAVPVWGLATVVARPDGSFLIIH